MWPQPWPCRQSASGGSACCCRPIISLLNAGTGARGGQATVMKLPAAASAVDTGKSAMYMHTECAWMPCSLQSTT